MVYHTAKINFFLQPQKSKPTWSVKKCFLPNPQCPECPKDFQDFSQGLKNVPRVPTQFK